ncbi:MAG: glycosyltransferase [Flavitalea sp.]
MAIFVFLFFVLLIIYGVLIERYRSWWNQAPEYSQVLNEVADFSNHTLEAGTIKEGLRNISATGTDTLENAPPPAGGLTISLIIAVRNEEKNIAALFSSLEQQDYPAGRYEIIVVDDHSDDHTWNLLTEVRVSWLPGIAERQRASLLLVKNDPQRHSKKSAIQTGIESASGELIVTTDADCRFHPRWLSVLASFYKEKDAVFIAAPVTMEAGRSLLSVFQCIDFLTLQGVTGASVYKGFHTMCNGANLAYPKSIFLEVNGFTGIDMIPSGDDMLLMHKIYARCPEKVFYLKSREAIVTTSTEKSWRDFFRQRIRWASKAVYYEDKRVLYTLALVYAFNFCFIVMAVTCCFHRSWTFLLILFLLAKTIIEYPFVNSISMFFGQQRLMKYFAVLQPLHILYILISGWLGKFGTYEWKKRKIKGTKGVNL